MKLKIILSLLVMVLAVSSSYASFPVKRVAVTTELGSTEVDSEEGEKVELMSPAAASQKSQGIALLFWWFLGWPFAAHRWYLGSPWYWNVLFIITFAGVGIWAIVDLIGILTGSYEPKNGRYKKDFF